ncbi:MULTISPECIES: DUF1622 domain-containing protein [unclassified Clostridium]|uniref:DUF1622 domain-containing protein n=1 Tax=unclassified Clostridium TaxID=2614128 RepID=UPI00110688A5|nr:MULTISPECIES: DUF1622 domain-containing protein [unclassified Clostridium]
MFSLIEMILPEMIHFMELIGIVIIFIGASRAFLRYAGSFFQRDKGCNIKLMLGSSLELGLEYKMGAEILKTVLIRDMNEILILGSIIVLRALLSFLIHYEMKHESVYVTEEQ